LKDAPECLKIGFRWRDRVVPRARLGFGPVGPAFDGGDHAHLVGHRELDDVSPAGIGRRLSPQVVQGYPLGVVAASACPAADAADRGEQVIVGAGVGEQDAEHVRVLDLGITAGLR
jgi:hypothetical protein